MSYHLYYDDLTNVQVTCNQALQTWSQGIEKINTQLTTFVSLPDLEGQAGDNMKAYFQEVHGTFFVSMMELIAEFQSRFLLYKDDCFGIDNNLHAELTEDVLTDLHTFFTTSRTDFEGQSTALRNAVNKVSDLLSYQGESGSSVDIDYSIVTTFLDTLREDVGTNEHTHKSNDLSTFKELLQAFTQLVQTYQNQDKSIVATYQTESIRALPEMLTLQKAYVKSQEEMQGLQTQLSQAIERDGQRFEALEQEAAEARMDAGIWQAVGAALTIVVGAAAIVLTAGAATPIVAVAAVSGVASMSYGVSNMVEAGQNIYYGANGDATILAFNPLRDTVFMGNQTAYDVFGFASTFVAGSMIPINQAVNLAQKVGTSVPKAVILGTGQSVVTAGAGYGGSILGENISYKISQDWFGADERTAGNISKATGMLTGVAAAAGTYKVTGNIVNQSIKNNVVSTDNVNGPKCFVSGTLILTAGGHKPIESIKIGEKVLARHENSNDHSYEKVVNLFVSKTSKLVKIIVGDEIIATTEEHPFYLSDKGWVKAKELTHKDSLIDNLGNKLSITDVRIICLNKTVNVYNFEVENAHTYFVSNLCILVHNICDDALDKWHKGTFDDSEASLKKHYEKHGAEVKADSIEQYFNKAEDFSRKLKGARTKNIDYPTPNVVRFYKNGKYIDIHKPTGKIISFGKQ